MTKITSNVWSAGKIIGGYKMLADAHAGEMAFSSKAQSPTGQVVFFKKYQQPNAETQSWYQGFVDYQKEIKRRVDAVSVNDKQGRNQGPTYRLLDFFEDVTERMSVKTLKKERIPQYCQVIEFIEGAKDLRSYLTSNETTWENRKKFATIFMYAMHVLHEKCQIIHSDLKPENVLLIPIVTEKGPSYQVKVIDLDFSILEDKQAPWHGLSGYVFTPGYASPEHLSGLVPCKKSDIFTCGLILYEILTCEGHPYGGEMNGDTRVWIPYEAHPAPLPSLRGTYGSPEQDTRVCQVLQKMLDPDPNKRPTAIEVQRILVGGGMTARRDSSVAEGRAARPAAPAPAPRVARPAAPAPAPTPAPRVARPAAPAPAPVPAPRVARPAAPAPAPKTAVFCKLKSSTNPSGIRVFPNMKIGHRYLKALDPEAMKYYSSEHIAISLRDGKWFLKHCAPADQNKTAVNKVLVTSEVELHNGDVIEAASKDGSKTVMPFTVEIGG